MPVRLVPKHRQDHRPNLNEVKGNLAVSADVGVPLLSQAQDGNQLKQAEKQANLERRLQNAPGCLERLPKWYARIAS